MRFGLLGEVAAWRDAGQVDVGPSRQRSVLAALLADANKLVPADVLLDRVWGDRPPQTARGTLSTYLTRLRQALAPVRIEGRSGGYRISVDPGTLDLDRFTDLLATARAADDRVAAGIYHKALELWRGEPLSGIDTPWANDLRDRLHRQRFAAELDHTDVRLRLGEHAILVAELATRTIEHPLDERLTGQYILALYRDGRLADAMAYYEEFRLRLRDELGADPAPPLRELHRRILAADKAVLAPNPSAPATVPRQLPSPPGSFTGRTGEVARLGGDAGTIVISAIGGGGGIGKTALALHWAHLNADLFPDGQLFVNLRGFDPSGRPTSPEAALRGFLGALGKTDIPADLDAQAGLYRSLVAGRKMLVLLDNAADTAQVGPLLPGSPTVTTLVTSRRPLTGLVAVHGAHAVPLDVLPDAEARELLARRLGADRLAAEPDAVAELVRHCAGLPLALSIIAARAIVQPERPLAALAAELRDHATRLDSLDTGETDLSLRAVFSLSHKALSPKTGRLAGLLALAPGPDISVAAVDILAGEDASAMLSELESAALIFRPAPGRFGMHDLVRLDAAERATSRRDTALRRLVDFYLRTAHAADRLLAPQRPPVTLTGPEPDRQPFPLRDKDDALTWLTTEHPCLLAAQRFAAERGWHAKVWELTQVTDTLHWRQGRTADHIAVQLIGIEAAKAAGNLVMEAKLHGGCGNVSIRAGRVAESVRHYEQAIALAGQSGERSLEAHSHSGIVEALGQQGDIVRARHHAAKALSLYRQLGETRWEAAALNSLGWECAQLGLYDEARTHCLAGHELERSVGEVTGEILDSLGYIDQHSGRLAEAVDWYRQALAIYEDAGDVYNIATTMIRLGEIHAIQGSRDDAKAAWQEALRLCESQQRSTEADDLRQRLNELARQ